MAIWAIIIGGWAIIIDWRLGLVSIALLPALVVGMMFQVFLLVGNITNIIFLVQIKLMMFDGAVQKGALEVQNSIETQKKISPCTCSKPVVCIISEVFQGASKHAVQAISNIRTVVGLRFQICVEERELLKKV